MNNFKIKVLCIFCGFVFHSYSLNAQERSTKKAKVVLVFNEKSGAITSLRLYRNFQKIDMESAKKFYPNSKFYIGTLQGSYHLKEDELIPTPGTTVTIYTQREYAWKEAISWSKDYRAGDAFALGKKPARVLSSEKGELTLRTQ